MMSRTTLPARTLFVALSIALCVQPLLAKSDHQQWVGTWASAPLLDAHAETADHLVAPGTTGVTLREVVHVSIGGEMLRVRFSNLYGTDPLVIGAAQIAQTLKGAAGFCSGLVTHEQQLATLVSKAQYSPLEISSGATDLIWPVCAARLP